jgi:two-component sensor histidine kinase
MALSARGDRSMPGRVHLPFAVPNGGVPMSDRRACPSGNQLSEERRSNLRRDEDRRLQLAREELEAAHKVSAVLFDKLEPDDVIEKSLITALDVIGAESGSILIAEKENMSLIFRHSMGEDPVEEGTIISWEEGIAGEVFRSGEPVIIGDIDSDSSLPILSSLAEGAIRDLVAVPLSWRGDKPVGVMMLRNKKAGCFGESDLSLLSLMSAISANSIERARLYEEAKLAEVAKLLGNIGHDIKNLLTPVVCGAEILEGELEKLFRHHPEEKGAALEKSKRRCRNTIAALYGTSRRIQDRVKEISDCIKGLSTEPRYELCSMGQVFKEVFDALTLPSQKKGVFLKTKGFDLLPEIMADERRLFSAFYNLVNNAIPEVPEGGFITVTGQEAADEAGLLISVADNGRGMPPEVRENLFTVKAVSSKRLGTGLGTKIVKDVIDAHNGWITVDSEEGKGTTFNMFLPLDPSSATV